MTETRERGRRTNEALRQQVTELRERLAATEALLEVRTQERDVARAAGQQSEAMRQRATTRITAAIDTLMGEAS